MNNYIVFIVLILFLFIVFYQRKNIINYIIKQRIKKRKESDCYMNELLKNFLDKDCIVYLINGGTADGVIKEINQNALIIANDRETQLINIDFIMRVKEYPKNKNGKRKSIVF